ncbi:GATOR complex protein NPRL3 [Lamellibrachia satsuma]|nr:GATOR complex protein NPRL3 [Lamellibrachia satsuma]
MFGKYPGTNVNPYAVRVTEDLSELRTPVSSISIRTLIGYSDKGLAALLAVKPALCGHKFEVKVNDVLFLGHPLIVPKTHPSSKHARVTMTSFNVVFALQGNADVMLISCYHDLSKQLAVALRHEEKRCGFLSEQASKMCSTQDDMASQPEDSLESPYGAMLMKCQLAKQLKSVYLSLCSSGVVQLYVNQWIHINYNVFSCSLCSSGVVQLYVNQWIHINFSLPHKVHMAHSPGMKITPKTIQRCVESLRPYHGMLLLVDEETLLDSLPPDGSPCLTRLIQVSSPLKNLQDLASDADLSLGQVFQLVTHLVYWGKAAIIYPLCESNVYVITPDTNMIVNSTLVEKFVELFPGMSLPAVISEFSLPTPLGEHRDVLGLPQQQAQQVQMVVWMLQHQLLVQLHIYVYRLPDIQTDRTHNKSAINFLSPDDLPALRRKDTRVSDAASSATSDESQGPTEKSSSFDIGSDGISDDARFQWHLLQDSLSTETKEHIMNIATPDNVEDSQLFVRLCPYFNGQHHLEEIMYYENVRRSQLLTLLDKFRDMLILCQHEDVGITTWLNDDKTPTLNRSW